MSLTSLPKNLQEALSQLNLALDRLEAVSERRANEDALRGNVDEELAVLQDDRTRLAVDLDGTLAHSKSLQIANEEVAQRLERVSANVRALVERLAPQMSEPHRVDRQSPNQAE